MSPAAHALPTLSHPDERLILRPSAPSDAPPLLLLLAEPAVAAWWGDNDLEGVTNEIVNAFTIEIDGMIAGMLQCHEETEPMYPGVAFDIMLGTRWHGQGHGRRALALAVEYFVSRGHHRFVIDPAIDNTAAIACYAAVGFRRAGILRQAERAPSGEFRDAMMMDLLASDLGLTPPMPAPYRGGT